MRYLLILLLVGTPTYAADALLCSPKHTSRVLGPNKVEVKHYIVLTEAEWDAVPLDLDARLRSNGVTRVAALGTGPSVAVLQAAEQRVRDGAFDCLAWTDPTRNDACDTLANTITRAADPVCDTILGLGPAVAASVGDGTASAKCKLPGGGHVRLTLRCDTP